MELQVIDRAFTVCRVQDGSQIDWTDDFCFAGKTDREFSLVCGTDCVPGNVLRREDGWRAFRIQGTLDFSLLGILADISAVLAERKISIFAVSTYDTDYVFTKEESFPAALRALEESDYTVTR